MERTVEIRLDKDKVDKLNDKLAGYVSDELDEAQEELDKVIASRLQRERETVTKQFQTQLDEQTQKVTGYENQVADLNKQIETLTGQVKEIGDLQSKVKAYETSSVKMRIAREVGLPFELADRLSGEDEKAIREDAEALHKLIGKNQPISPVAGLERDGGGNNDNNNSGWLDVIKQMSKGEN